MLEIPDRFASMPPYTPIEPFEILSERLGLPVESIVKLDANENPYGPSPKVRQALADLPFAHIYPDPESRALRAALAGYTGAPVENILAGSGADELIDLVLRILLQPGDRVLTCPPSFGMYPWATDVNAGQLVEVPRQADFSLDLPAIQAAVAAHRPRVMFLAAPNNPDGSMPTPAEIEALLDLPLLLVLDEAYIEFTRTGGRLGEQLSWIRAVPQRQNLVVLRTFSKWAGLAGLRVGYGAFPDWMIPTLWKAKQPYNVNVAANAAALASLQDLDYLAGNVARLRAERERLWQGLAAVSFLQPAPTESNFILCRVTGRSGAELKSCLAARGVLVRHYNNALLQNYIRVSVGRPQDTAAVLAALEAVQ